MRRGRTQRAVNIAAMALAATIVVPVVSSADPPWDQLSKLLEPAAPAAGQLAVVYSTGGAQAQSALTAAAGALAQADPLILQLAGASAAAQSGLDEAFAGSEPVLAAVAPLTDQAADALASSRGQAATAIAQQESGLRTLGEAMTNLGPALAPICTAGGYSGVLLLLIPPDLGIEGLLVPVDEACADGGSAPEVPDVLLQAEQQYNALVADAALALDPVRPALQPPSYVVCSTTAVLLVAPALSPSVAPIAGLATPIPTFACWQGQGSDPTDAVMPFVVSTKTELDPLIEQGTTSLEALRPALSPLEPVTRPWLEGPCSLVDLGKLAWALLLGDSPFSADEIADPIARTVCAVGPAGGIEAGEGPLPGGFEGEEAPHLPDLLALPPFQAPGETLLPPAAEPAAGQGPAAAPNPVSREGSSPAGRTLPLALALAAAVSTGAAVVWRARRLRVLARPAGA